MKAYFIKPNEDRQEVHPENGSTFSLKELQHYVDGLIEIVYSLPGNLCMVVNEEGLVLGLPLNIEASILANRPIVGNVVVCDKSMIE